MLAAGGGMPDNKTRQQNEQKGFKFLKRLTTFVEASDGGALYRFPVGISRLQNTLALGSERVQKGFGEPVGLMENFGQPPKFAPKNEGENSKDTHSSTAKLKLRENLTTHARNIVCRCCGKREGGEGGLT